MVNVVVRPMIIEDYDQVAALWESTAGVGLDEGDDERAGIDSYLERNPGLSFTATADGKIIGAVLCGHDGRRGYLHHLAVNPAYRGNGIGRNLVDNCLSALKQIGIRKCNIMVFDDNDTGLGFWRNTGWIDKEGLLLMQMPIDCEHDSASG